MAKSSKLNLADEVRLMRLIRTIVQSDSGEAAKLIAEFPELARQRVSTGATRQSETDFFLEEIKHYIYAGDTALHAAAAGYQIDCAKLLLRSGADVRVANRRGAQPLHYAADGSPRSSRSNSIAQAEMIGLLVHSGADPNALDKSGVAPLHRAVRHRCVEAVEALLQNGAAVRLRNKSGSTPLHLAVQTTGRGGSGAPEAKASQREIIRLLLKAGADPKDRDGKGRTVRQCIQGNWILALL